MGRHLKKKLIQDRHKDIFVILGTIHGNTLTSYALQVTGDSLKKANTAQRTRHCALSANKNKMCRRKREETIQTFKNTERSKNCQKDGKKYIRKKNKKDTKRNCKS